MKTVLDEENEENVLLSFQEAAEDSSDEELLAGREEAGDNEDSSDDDEVADPPQEVDSRLPFKCPAGFQALEKPAAFITSATGVKDLFIVMLWKEDGWELGKVVKYARIESIYRVVLGGTPYVLVKGKWFP
ncbi:hypothetical protein CYMTET_49272 [Cymbomonas tetramitiformis]|uniref:Uncharacterized protein n=1 Tax=Cymbomonas tetramitiformis TaxID=36881 RepID=A0AAE0EUB0_9CHLO|nr:hypothetical protein CYMTET_49272 [Cymbomonas tetramitiformis]